MTADCWIKCSSCKGTGAAVRGIRNSPPCLACKGSGIVLKGKAS